MDSIKILGIIPARYASTRFPGKPLVEIEGKPMIVRVAQQAAKSAYISRVVVATDDERISNACKRYQIEAIMTSSHHPSGTDRCLEAFTKCQEDFDVVVNIQGDEPFISPAHIDAACSCFEDSSCEIATLVYAANNPEYLQNPNRIKVVTDYRNDALYFSRSPIPFNRNESQKHSFLLHIGLYAYRSETLKKIAVLPPSELEEIEMLEQLRWLQNGYKIKTQKVDSPAISIDTPEDLQHLLQSLKK